MEQNKTKPSELNWTENKWNGVPIVFTACNTQTHTGKMRKKNNFLIHLSPDDGKNLYSLFICILVGISAYLHMCIYVSICVYVQDMFEIRITVVPLCSFVVLCWFSS